MVRRTSSSNNLPFIQGCAVNPAGTGRRAGKTDRKVAGQIDAKGIAKMAGQTLPVPAPVSMDDIMLLGSVVVKGLSAFAKAIAKQLKKMKPLLQDARQGIPQQVLRREIANQRRLGSSEGRYEVPNTSISERAARAFGLGGDEGLTVDYDEEDTDRNADITRQENERRQA